MLFNEAGELKKWVVVVFHLLLPLVFGTWGIYLSIASYNLSKEMNSNREQIDTLTTMVKELRNQNSLLQRSVSIQDSQLTAYSDERKYTKRPQLKAELWGGELGDISNLQVKVSNSGGDISNLIVTPLKGVKINAGELPKHGIIASGSSCILNLSNLKSGAGMRFVFTDGLMNRYSQDLIWKLQGEVFELGILKELRK